MTPSQALAPRPSITLDTVQRILGALVARYHKAEVLTSVRQIPAREGEFRPVPGWVASALSEAYRAKGIQELYSHQAATAELVHDGRNVVVVANDPAEISDPLLEGREFPDPWIQGAPTEPAR